MLCKTRIVFSDEYSVTGIPNRAMADETRSPNYNGTPFSLGISLKHLVAELEIGGDTVKDYRPCTCDQKLNILT